MKYVFGLLAFAAVIGAAVWLLPKLASGSAAPKTTGSAAAATVKEAATEVKQTAGEAVDFQSGAEEELYGQTVPGYAYLGIPGLAYWAWNGFPDESQDWW